MRVRTCSTSAMASRPSHLVTAVPMRSAAPMYCTSLPLRSAPGHSRSIERTADYAIRRLSQMSNLRPISEHATRKS